MQFEVILLATVALIHVQEEKKFQPPEYNHLTIIRMDCLTCALG